MNESIKFSVTRDKLESARTRLVSAGVPVVGDSGRVSEKGFTVSYLFDEVANVLTLVLEKKPFFVPVSVIKSKLKDALKEEGVFEV